MVPRLCKLMGMTDLACCMRRSISLSHKYIPFSALTTKITELLIRSQYLVGRIFAIRLVGQVTTRWGGDCLTWLRESALKMTKKYQRNAVAGAQYACFSTRCAEMQVRYIPESRSLIIASML